MFGPIGGKQSVSNHTIVLSWRTTQLRFQIFRRDSKSHQHSLNQTVYILIIKRLRSCLNLTML